MKYNIVLVHKDCIKIGDIILCKDGKVRTVCRKNITNGFMGVCLFGDSYRLGQAPVKKITDLVF